MSNVGSRVLLPIGYGIAILSLVLGTTLACGGKPIARSLSPRKGDRL